MLLYGRPLSKESGSNDCLWENDPEVPVQHSSLKFHLNQGDTFSESAILLPFIITLISEVWRI
jgi:hypothetical protein